MREIQLDQYLRSKIGDLAFEVVVKDEEGRVVGYFVPQSQRISVIEVFSAASIEAEFQTRIDLLVRNKQGKTYPEVLASLRQRGIPGVPEV